MEQYGAIHIECFVAFKNREYVQQTEINCAKIKLKCLSTSGVLHFAICCVSHKNP